MDKCKFFKKSIWLTFGVFLLYSSFGFSQKSEQTDSLKNKLMNAASEIIAASATCALITQDNEGRSRVRVMDPFPPESDFSVWFGTNPKSRKVDQIKNDPRVTLYYLDSIASGYVMINGIAQLVDDPKEKAKRWKDEWKLYYPEKPEGYLLIKVSPQWMEVISYSHGIVGDPSTWEPPIVLFNTED